MSLEATEAECAAHAVAPRVSLSDIESAIAERHHLNAGAVIERETGIPTHALNVLSICILVMKNGFSVVGKSAPASPENFDKALGEKLAYEDAIRQLWPLMGFNLREHLWREGAFSA